MTADKDRKDDAQPDEDDVIDLSDGSLDVVQGGGRKPRWSTVTGSKLGDDPVFAINNDTLVGGSPGDTLSTK